MFTIKAYKGTTEHVYQGVSYAFAEQPRRIVVDAPVPKEGDPPPPQLIMLQVADDLPAPYDRVEVLNVEGNKVGGYLQVTAEESAQIDQAMANAAKAVANKKEMN